MAGTQVINASRFSGFRVQASMLTLVTDKNHPLYSPDVEDALDPAFVANIKLLGVQEPVIVTKDGDKILVVDGRKRTKAAIEASKLLAKEGQPECLVPVIVQRGTDSQLAEIMVSMNEIRKEDSPLTKAFKAKRLMDLGYTVDRVAISFGKTTQTIRNWLSLLDLDVTIQQKVERREITPTAAIQLAGLSKEEQKNTLATLTAPTNEEQAKPRARVATVARAAKAAKAGKDAGEVSNAPSRHLIRRLYNAAGDSLSAEERKLIRWFLGDGPAPSSINKVLKTIGAA